MPKRFTKSPAKNTPLLLILAKAEPVEPLWLHQLPLEALAEKKAAAVEPRNAVPCGKLYENLVSFINLYEEKPVYIVKIEYSVFHFRRKYSIKQHVLEKAIS